jgi:hypothetical protein
MGPSRSLTFVLPVALLLGACAELRSWEVTAKASPTANFPAFKTYAFVPADRLDMTGSQMLDPVTRRNLEAAIGRELQARGLSPAPTDTSPSLLVSYFADVYEGPDKNRPVSGGAGGSNWQRQGQLTIDIIDTADQQVVWHGEAWARDPNFRIADQLIADLLRKYPQAR